MLPLGCRHTFHIPKTALRNPSTVVDTSGEGRNVQAFLITVLPENPTQVPVLTKNGTV